MNHFSWRATHSCILFRTDLRRSRVIGVSEKQHRGVQCKNKMPRGPFFTRKKRWRRTLLRSVPGSMRGLSGSRSIHPSTTAASSTVCWLVRLAWPAPSRRRPKTRWRTQAQKDSALRGPWPRRPRSPASCSPAHVDPERGRADGWPRHAGRRVAGTRGMVFSERSCG